MGSVSRRAEGGTSAVELRVTEDEHLWEALVRDSPGGTAFHSWDWLDLQERVLGGVFERLVVWADGHPVGVFPVGRPGPTSVGQMAAPFPYVGPLVPVRHLPGALRAMRHRQRRQGPAVVRLEFGLGSPAGLADALVAAGCRPRLTGTVVVELHGRTIEEVRAGYSRTRRREIRRARRNGAEVREATPGELAQLLPSLTDEAFAVHGAANPYPGRTGQLVEEHARGRADVGVFTGLAGGKAVGTAVVLEGHPDALFWLGTSLREFRSLHLNDLLYDAIIAWALERGCERIDLCGSVDEGILSYKLTFGGVEKFYLLSEVSPVPASALNAIRSVRARVRSG